MHRQRVMRKVGYVRYGAADIAQLFFKSVISVDFRCGKGVTVKALSGTAPGPPRPAQHAQLHGP